MTGEYQARGNRGRDPFQRMTEVVERMIEGCDKIQARRPGMAEEIGKLRNDLTVVLERLRGMQKG